MKPIQLLITFCAMMLLSSVHAANAAPVLVDEVVCKGSPNMIDLNIKKFSDGRASYCLKYSGSGALLCSAGQMNGWEIEGTLIATSPVVNNTYKAVFSYQVEDTWTKFENVPLTCVITEN